MKNSDYIEYVDDLINEYYDNELSVANRMAFEARMASSDVLNSYSCREYFNNLKISISINKIKTILKVIL